MTNDKLPTKEERMKIMDKALETHGDLLSNLYVRWQNEKEHEDFKDYEKVMKEKVGSKTFIKATKRPFGFVIQLPNFPYKCQLFADRRGIGWRSV